MTDEKPTSDSFWINLMKENEKIRENDLKEWRISKLENLIAKIVDNFLFYSKITFLFIIIFILLELSKWGIYKICIGK